jgi:hypothetical protein
VFGFFKRLREHHRSGRTAAEMPSTVASTLPVEGDAPQIDDRPGKSWYGSSLDLHEGLEISDVEDDVTQPMPLHEVKERR